ncbi:MAG: hypothetical protein R3C60_12885 [Parvularculaceae bacterium]
MSTRADMIFPEAMKDEKEFGSRARRTRRADSGQHDGVRKVASPQQKELENLGFNLVIYPVTTLRVAMFGAEKGLTPFSLMAISVASSTSCSTGVISTISCAITITTSSISRSTIQVGDTPTE